ncbi:MAG TPA: metal-sulfur cluster assembly factor [Nitrolancea sp.]|nr:metal-sulfur cluster assembly factor [Nitrolancea sp.]
MSSLLLSEAAVRAALYEVYDPELGINVVDLGLVYGVDITGSNVTVTMTLTTPGCPLHDSLTAAVDEAVRVFVPSVEDVAVNLVWEPAWSPEMITEAGRDELGWWG